MDSSDGGPEKSLPGMGMPRWMKKTTERHSYADICASPPTNEDGFLYISRHRASANSDAPGNVECYQKKKSGFRVVETSPEMIPPTTSGGTELSNKPQNFGKGAIVLAKQDCTTLKETSNFYKTIATTTASSTLAKLAIASQEGLTAPPKLTSVTTTEVTVNGKPKPSISSEFDIAKAPTSTATLDSAHTSSDSSAIVVGSSTKPKSSEHQMNPPLSSTIQQLLVAKRNGILSFQPDETTPSSTPNATPTSSPQVSRRTGNPFFSGSQEKPNTGNWLFRSSSPGPSSNNKNDDLYDLKGDLSRPSSAGSTSSSQKIRYAPRPSEFRELNFWSPTSM